MKPPREEYEAMIYRVAELSKHIEYSDMVLIPKHVPPDMKHHRIPAPDISFKESNLLFLIKEY